MKKKKSIKEIIEEKEANNKGRANNNKVIQGIGLGKDKHWIWDLITLENVIILGGCYLLWQLVKEDKR